MCCHVSLVWVDGLSHISLHKLDVRCFPHSVLNALALEDYRKNHWPNLEKAIDRLLLHNPTEHISVSYAQIYRSGSVNNHISFELNLYFDLYFQANPVGIMIWFVLLCLAMSTSVFASSTPNCSTMI